MRKQALKTEPKRERTEFKTNREMDFFTEKELTTQTGHPKPKWPQVILKELIDNSLDACDEVGTPPTIDICATECGIAVSDNGPGMSAATLDAAINFRIRSSTREAYVAPDRGAQGNALMTLLAMPRILDQVAGRLVVEAHGKRHEINCGADQITQRPIVRDRATLQQTVGTKVELQWALRCNEAGETLWPFAPHCRPKESEFASTIRLLIEGFAFFNPHLTIRLDWFGALTKWDATDTNWIKWTPSKPTSAHWYEKQHLERLVAAFIAHDRSSGADRFVSEFLEEFDGLSGSKKRSMVLRDAHMLRMRLSGLVTGDQLDHGRISQLLTAMQQHTRPVAPRRLGIIGVDHFKSRLIEMGITPESFRYVCKLSKSKNGPAAKGSKASFSHELPWIIESAFGWFDGDTRADRRLFAGANWSMAIGNPFRSFGASGEGLEATLTDLKAGANEPIVFAVHLAQPRIEFTDRGKSALVIGDDK